MIVVADASPVHYLVLIGAAEVLEPLYGRVLVPQAVADELQAANTPEAVRAWMAHLPPWCEVRPDAPSDPAVRYLDAGEQAAIALALSVNADRLLIDERAGRVEAEHRGVLVTGTVCVLAEAHRRALLGFEASLARLRATNFHVSSDLMDRVRQRLARTGL